MPRARLVKVGEKIHIQTQRVSRKEKLQYMDWDWIPKLEHPIVLREVQGKFTKGEFDKWLRKLNKKHTPANKKTTSKATSKEKKLSQ